MAVKKKAPAAERSAEPVFRKEKILTFQRYNSRADLLSVLLEDGKTYTLHQVDDLIANFMKGKVKG